MKPIHNFYVPWFVFFYVVFIISKIQNETNSQPFTANELYPACCFYHIKDTK